MATIQVKKGKTHNFYLEASILMVCSLLTGLLGDLQHSKAEIAWANLFITRDRLRIMDFSDWYLYDPSCFLFKQPKPYVGMLTLLFPLELETWFFILISLVILNLFNLIYSVVWKKPSFSQLLMYHASVTFKESHYFSHVSYTVTFRYFHSNEL